MVLTAGVVVTEQPVAGDALPVHAAVFNASTTRDACIVRPAFQPTIRRENTSIPNASSTALDHVER